MGASVAVASSWGWWHLQGGSVRWKPSQGGGWWWQRSITIGQALTRIRIGSVQQSEGPSLAPQRPPAPAHLLGGREAGDGVEEAAQVGGVLQPNVPPPPADHLQLDGAAGVEKAAAPFFADGGNLRPGPGVKERHGGVRGEQAGPVQGEVAEAAELEVGRREDDRRRFDRHLFLLLWVPRDFCWMLLMVVVMLLLLGFFFWKMWSWFVGEPMIVSTQNELAVFVLSFCCCSVVVLLLQSESVSTCGEEGRRLTVERKKICWLSVFADNEIAAPVRRWGAAATC